MLFWSVTLNIVKALHTGLSQRLFLPPMRPNLSGSLADCGINDDFIESLGQTVRRPRPPCFC